MLCPPSMTLEKQPRVTCHWRACMRLSYEAGTSKWVLLNAANWTVPLSLPKNKKNLILPVDLFLNQWTKAILIINFYQHYLPWISEVLCQTTLIRRFRHCFILSRWHFAKPVGQVPSGRSACREACVTVPERDIQFFHTLILMIRGAGASSADACYISHRVLHFSKSTRMCRYQSSLITWKQQVRHHLLYFAKLKVRMERRMSLYCRAY